MLKFDEFSLIKESLEEVNEKTLLIKSKLRISKSKLLEKIGAKKIEFNDLIESDKKYTFKNIEQLMSSTGAKKALMESGLMLDMNLFDTAEYETFVDSNIKILFIYKKNSIVLDQAPYFALESKGNYVEFYSLIKDKNIMMDLLNKREIRFEIDDEFYEYTSTNGGNMWDLTKYNQRKVKYKLDFKNKMYYQDLKDTLRKYQKNVKIDFKLN